MTKQRALLLIKPDAVQRGLIGKIVKRFEQAGLKIIGLKFVWATSEEIKSHYPETEAWFKKVGERTLSNYKKKGLDAGKVFGTNDAMAIGKTVIASKVSGIQEVIQSGYNGILVDPNNPKDWCEAIEAVLDSETLQIELGKNAMESVKKYDWSVSVAFLEHILLKLIERKKE